MCVCREFQVERNTAINRYQQVPNCGAISIPLAKAGRMMAE